MPQGKRGGAKESGRGVTAGLVALTIYRVLRARGSATPSTAVCVWCDRAEKSSLISQRLPLPLSRSPPSRLPSLLALSRSLLCLSRGVSVPECSQSSSGNLDLEPVCTRSRTHARTHAHSLAHTHSGSPHGDTQQTRSFIYLKGMARPDTSCSLVISAGQSNVGTREARRPLCSLTLYAATSA